MEIRVLRYFLETAREGNMTRAAQRLFISQPTMSKQLKELDQLQHSIDGSRYAAAGAGGRHSVTGR